ncbi:MAG: type II toxin-antitoxin system VapC family toxin [Dehalococcoidia bacterium]|nr:type II toxin-antitoxin system VapC family toxin [Dehalococcoidia bacterium]
MSPHHLRRTQRPNGRPLTLIVLDTNVVSYIFNNDSRARFYTEHLQGQRAFISFQTLEEIWNGAYRDSWGSRRKDDLTEYLEQYEVVWPDPDLVDSCARLRSERRAVGRELGIADAWIAATALMLNCPLATADRDFINIPGLRLIQAA